MTKPNWWKMDPIEYLNAQKRLAADFAWAVAGATIHSLLAILCAVILLAEPTTYWSIALALNAVCAYLYYRSARRRWGRI